MVIPVVLLLIMGVVFFTISSVSDDNPGDINEEISATEEMDEPAVTVEEEDTGETEEKDEDPSDTPAGNNGNYTAAEQCIMSELKECDGVAEADRSLAYQNLVEDGTLPQSPVSDCLPCTVKYSFAAEYGESKPIDLSVFPRSEEAPGEINNHLQFVRQYLLPCLDTITIRITKHLNSTRLAQPAKIY